MGSTGRIAGVAVLVAAVVAGVAPVGSFGVERPPRRDDSGQRRVIVVLSHGDPAAVAATHSRRYGAEVSRVYDTALVGYAARLPPRAADRLADAERVAYIDPDLWVRAAGRRCGRRDVTNACDGGGAVASIGDRGEGIGATEDRVDTVPWGVERTGARSVHEEHPGAGVSIYVIDTGIQAEHPDLQGNLGEGHAVVPCLVLCAELWGDDHGHGTHVAGTAAAADNGGVVGVAPQATLHAVKVLNALGVGLRSDVIAGVDWVAQQEKDNATPAVANMSLGGAGEKQGACGPNGFTGEDAYHEAICGATRQGVVFAVAAGNSDADASETVPAAYDDTVMTLSATTCEFAGDAADQNCEDNSDGWWDDSNHGDVITVAAPGSDILSTWNDGGYRLASGTSMASPHAAGAAALLIGADEVSGSGYGAFDSVQQTVVSTAEPTDPGSTHWPADPDHDEGFLDVDAALSP